MFFNFKELIFSQFRDIISKNVEVYYACML